MMMFNSKVKSTTLLGATLFASAVSFAQNPSLPAPKAIVPPSPNSQAFAKYGNIPVSLYTGTPNISVPIYEIKARGITVPINLSYHASGIKVSEEASRVGLGWVLNAGGMISRNVINGDDFDGGPEGFLSPLRNTAAILPSDTISMYIPGGTTPHNPGELQEGVVAKFLDPGNHGPNNYRSFDLETFIDGQNFDFEPDQFNYNFLGQSGKFIIRQNTSHALEVVLEKKNKMLITTNGSGSSFNVKTSDGTAYLFDVVETYRSQGEAQTDHKSTWYLSKITSSTGDEVSFHYTTVNQFLKSFGTIRETRQGYQSGCDPQYPCSSLVTYDLPEYIAGKNYNTVRLDSILWDNGKVEFVAGQRVDVMNDIRIEQVNIYSRNITTDSYTLKEIYDLGYDYFVASNNTTVFTVSDGDATPDRLNKRLKLETVTRRSPADPILNDFHYRFEYYYDGLPPKNAWSRDHWGYPLFNGLTSLIPSYAHVAQVTNIDQVEGVMGPEREADYSPRTSGTLKAIYYPTGGHSEFLYEAHTYAIQGSGSSGSNNGNWRDAIPFVQAWNDPQTPHDLDLTDEYEDEHGSTVAVDISVGFIYKVENWLEYENCSPRDIGYFEIYKVVGSDVSTYKRVGVSFPPCIGSNTLDCMACNQADKVIKVRVMTVLPRGEYKMIAKFNNGDLDRISSMVTYTVDGSIRPKQQQSSDELYAYAGGLRIREITDFDPESNREYNKRTYDYHLIGGDGQMRSYGKLMVTPRYSYFDIAYQRIDIGNGFMADCTECVYVIRQSDSFMPATGSLGNSVGYTKVKERFTDLRITPQSLAPKNGMTEYEYINIPETVRSYKYAANSNYEMRPPAVSTMSDPLNGMLIRQTDYNTNDGKVHEILYTHSGGQQRWEYGIEVRKLVMKNFDGFVDPTAADPNRNPKSFYQLYLYPALSSTFVYNSRKIESFSNGTSDTTDYFYENPLHLQQTKVKTTTSERQTIETITKYSHDYATPDAILTNMKQSTRYMPGVPIETKTVNLTSGRTINHNINVFGSFGPNNYILLKDVIDLNVAVAPLSLPVYNPSAGYNSSFYRKVYSMNYNQQGNVKLIQKESNLPVSYLWGVRNTMPIAEITNATTDESFLQNFEEGWALAASISPHTGHNYYPGDFLVTFSRPNQKSYVIEYWFYDNGQWHHKQSDYTVSVTLTDGSAIDDVRIYPKDAMMKSFTYDPLGEITSTISESGHTKVYEYDTFSRLIRVRNDRNEIEKQYTYNYKKY